LSACNTHAADLSTVQQYAKATATAGAAFGAVSNDLYESCLRYREYAQPASVGGEPLWSNIPERQPEPTPPPPGVAPTPLDGAENDADCHVSSELANRWNLEDQALLGYVHALGTVAGVDVMPSNFDSLSGTLKRSGVIGNDAVASAAGDVAQHIAASLIAARQRHDVYLIAQAAQTGGLDRLVRDLQLVTTDTYRRKLDNERTAVAAFYTTILQKEARELAALECPVTSDSQVRRSLSCARYPPTRSKLSLSRRILADGQAAQLRDLIRRQRLARQDAFDQIDARKNAAKAYSRAVGDIARGNDAILTLKSGDLNAIVQSVKPYVADLKDNVSTLISALKK